MPTSESSVYVWAWPAGQSTPVPAGVVYQRGSAHLFRYGTSWLNRPDSIDLFGIPRRNQPIRPEAGLSLHGCLRDALPDAWGQRVILQRLTGLSGRAADTADLDDLTYMMESGSDRFGAIDFQADPTTYVARSQSAVTVAELAEATARLDEGLVLPPGLDAALAHGTSVGGARPKATISDGDDHWIAKFSSSSDLRPVVREEALALELARRAGVRVVDHRLDRVAGRDVLLVRRFDRGDGGVRFHAVSCLTLCGLDEMLGRYASYPQLLDVLRLRSATPEHVGAELFERIAVNIVLGNNDDHARNHAALWDGTHLELSPAYDLDPGRSPGRDCNQAMAYGRDNQRVSNLAALIECHPVYGLTRKQARASVDRIVTTVSEGFVEAVDAAHLARREAAQVWGSRILNPGVLDGLSGHFMF